MADFSLNVSNALSADWLLAGQGVRRVTPAAELPLEGLRQLTSVIGDDGLEVILHRHTPVMHMAHCIAAAWLARGASGEACRAACRRMKFVLVDRIGERLAVTCDENHHNAIFAPMASSAADDIGAFRGMGIFNYRLELLQESADQARQLVELYTTWLAADGAPAEAMRQLARMGLRSRPI